jgi:hypothetical protein
MDINNLELKLLKSSQVEDGDIILVKIDDKEKAGLKKEDVESLYTKITQMINKKNIGIYFFPKNISIDMIKNHVKLTKDIENQINENIPNPDSNI